jgi:pyruvate dehydrogenase E1 component alpha subunit
MWKTRLVDERMMILQRQGQISFAMTSLGEEACAVGSAAALDPTDWLYPQYREQGIMFWRGMSIESYMHHMYGNSLDFNKGRQMPNHFGSKEHNIVTVSSPIGTKIPHASGAGYAMKLQKERAIAVCYFGEGATSEGDFHTGVNFAAVRKSQTLFFCRNNQYAISTKTDHQYASEGVAAKGVGYGIPVLRVDGNDFFAVYEAVKEAKMRILEGGAPFLIEALTYRLGAHSSSDDPSRYREEKEVALWKEKCPIKRLSSYLEKKGLWSKEKEKKWEMEVKEEIEQAITKAQSLPPPPMESIIEDVYAEVPPSLQRQLDEVIAICPKKT